ncbi:MAG: glycosyltransferase family 4 protein [Acidobacteria bacterium]|nr:glycosyltransferase family 4 protein [Acidobacteriota bacterium]
MLIQVLFVAAELAPWKKGGISNVVQKLGNALAAKSELRVTILGTVPEPVRGAPEGYHQNLEFIYVRRPLKLEPWYHIQLQSRYRAAVSQWIRQNSQGIVHFHILPGARAFSAAAAALDRTTAVALTHHDWAPFEIPYYSYRWAHRLHWRMSRLLLGRFNHLVTNSDFIASAVRASYPAPTPVVIPNGICVEEWNLKQAPAVLEGFPRILYWGALWAKKGVDILIQAFARLHVNVSRARLYIAGTGPEAKKLKAMARKLGVSAGVKFLGRVDDHNLASLIHGCDLAVFPSAYEGFGIAILEAMACGKAVITTAHGGPSGFISNGHDGILLPERTSSALAESLEQLALDPERIQRLGMCARNTALRYDWSQIAPAYIKFYEDIVRHSYSSAGMPVKTSAIRQSICKSQNV